MQSGQLRPKWPRGSPRGLVDITLRCWAQEPELRPTFSDIIKELDEVEGGLRTELLARLSLSPAATSVSDAGSSTSSVAAAAAWAGGQAREPASAAHHHHHQPAPGQGTDWGSLKVLAKASLSRTVGAQAEGAGHPSGLRHCHA